MPDARAMTSLACQVASASEVYTAFAFRVAQTVKKKVIALRPMSSRVCWGMITACAFHFWQHGKVPGLDVLVGDRFRNSVAG